MKAVWCVPTLCNFVTFIYSGCCLPKEGVLTEMLAYVLDVYVELCLEGEQY